MKEMSKTRIELPAETGNGPCISVIVPFNKISSGLLENPKRLNAALRKANRMLEDNYPGWAPEFSKKLKALSQTVNLKQPGAGAAIFLSQTVSKVVKFVYPVSERVIVDESFEVRDLVHEFRLPHGYLVLCIGTNRTTLYRNVADELKEVKNETFPMKFTDDREYAKSSVMSARGHVRRATPSDKNTIHKSRVGTFIKSIGNFLKEENLSKAPLFVIGLNEHLSAFRDANLRGIEWGGSSPVDGEKLSKPQLVSLTEKMINEYLKRKAQQDLATFKEKIATGLTAFGPEDCWAAAQNGNCLNLYVELGFERPGWISPDGNSISTRERKGWHKVPDLIDDLMEIALHQGAGVIFLPDGSLKNSGKIAAVKRFAE